MTETQGADQLRAMKNADKELETFAGHVHLYSAQCFRAAAEGQKDREGGTQARDQDWQAPQVGHRRKE